ncbi:MAG TPA: hypothetical protein DEA08_09890 [Planctomycetes bacterium]|nr:hypothetical protein [Planctomycetota bacterium]
MTTTSERAELQDRIEAKRKELEARLASFKADGRKHSRESKQALEERLAKLEESLAQGWDDMSEKVAAKLNRWLEDGDE